MRPPTLIAGLIGGSLWLGLLTLTAPLLALAIPFVIYLGIAAMLQANPPRLRVTRRLSRERITDGAPVDVVLTITNEGTNLDEVTIRDRLPAGTEVIDGAASALAALAAGATIELAYTLQARRGVYHFPGVTVSTYDPFGLFEREILVPAHGHLTVLPEVVRLRALDIRPRHTRVYAGDVLARNGGPGIQFFGVRTYQPGDPLRWINPRATAKHPDQLLVNEFEQERAVDVGLILDARLGTDVGVGADALFEHMVTATAALADTLLRRGNRVGLVIYAAASDWTFPGSGNLQRERILRALARAKSHHHDVKGLNLLPVRLFPPRSQIILISPLQPADLEMLVTLRAREYQLLVISPDPVPLEQEALGPGGDVELAAQIAALERQLLLYRLGQLGIPVLDWNIRTPFAQVVNTALGRRRARESSLPRAST